MHSLATKGAQKSIRLPCVDELKYCHGLNMPFKLSDRWYWLTVSWSLRIVFHMPRAGICRWLFYPSVCLFSNWYHMSLGTKDSSASGHSARVCATTKTSHQSRVAMLPWRCVQTGSQLKKWISLGLPNCLCPMSRKGKICKWITEINTVSQWFWEISEVNICLFLV